MCSFGVGVTNSHSTNLTPRMESTAKVNATLHWDHFDAVLRAGLHQLWFDQDFVDVTLACQGQFVKAHKNVLSVCSTFFQTVFKENPCKHPVVILQGAKYSHVRSLVNFMYTGETMVPHNELPAFLKTAETLQIKGLVNNTQEHEDDFWNEDLLESIPNYQVKRRRLEGTETLTTSAQEWVSNLEDAPDIATAISFVDEDIKYDVPQPSSSKSSVSTSNSYKLKVNAAQQTTSPERKVTRSNGCHMSDDDSDNDTYSSSTNNSHTDAATSSVQPEDQPSSSGASKNDAETSEMMLDRMLHLRTKSTRSNARLAQLEAQEDVVLGGRLPVNTMAELQRLESDLNNTDFFTAMCNYLGHLGGKTQTEVSERIFAKVIDPNIMEKSCPDVNQAFTSRNLTDFPNVVKLVNVAVKLTPLCKDLRISEVFRIFKSWLKDGSLKPPKRSSSATIKRRRSSVRSPVHVSTSNNDYAKPYLTYYRKSLSNNRQMMLDRMLHLRTKSTRSNARLAQLEAQEDVVLGGRLPVNTMAELQRLESDLNNTDFFTAMCNYLGHLGGKTQTEVSERIFAKVIDPNIMEKSCPDVNQAFTSRNLTDFPNVVKLVNVAVKLTPLCKDLRISEVFRIFKSWLKDGSLKPPKRSSSATIKRRRSSVRSPVHVSTSNNDYAKPYLTYYRKSLSNNRRRSSRDKK
ncbi:hypothetical protein B566_EDAN017130 [Ephemera danica]|nr:hypothetical protein B566_EDAN017130 [Ephemera danica]